ncbi:MAG: FprA family A-type flavoprotein [Actinobacteria bacterium]|nr:FprA family A-type flavoprotein [Actinomycetota bacterium]
MSVREIRPDVYWVGSIDWDRRLFDELILLPDGTSYNSYLVKGSEKTALIDTVDPSKIDEFFGNLKELGVDKIDFIIVNHAEQDHSGSIPDVLANFSAAKILTNPKCKDMLMNLLLIPDEKFITVVDREKVSLGNITLEFIYAPWVHWPETMFTYLEDEKILFTCDFLGSHLATSDLFVSNYDDVYRAAKRYYAEIMMPFRTSIVAHLEKLKSLKVEIAAPSHGPLYNKPESIIDAYRDWVSDKVTNRVIIPYVSMHHSTKAMVDYFVDALIKRKIGVRKFSLINSDIGELAMELVDAATVVIGSPTVLVGAHPAAVYAAYITNILRPKTKFISIIGSYGWGSKMVENLTGMLANLKAEWLEPVIAKGIPKETDYKALDGLADRILEKHRELNII